MFSILTFRGVLLVICGGFPRAPVILRERQERWRSLQSWRKVAMGQVIPNRFHSQVFGSVLNSWHPLPRHKISLDERCWYQKIIARYRTCTQIFGSVLLLMAEFRRENQLIYRERPIYLQGFYTSQGGWDWDFWAINRTCKNFPGEKCPPVSWKFSPPEECWSFRSARCWWLQPVSLRNIPWANQRPRFFRSPAIGWEWMEVMFDVLASPFPQKKWSQKILGDFFFWGGGCCLRFKFSCFFVWRIVLKKTQELRCFFQNVLREIWFKDSSTFSETWITLAVDHIRRSKEPNKIRLKKSPMGFLGLEMWPKGMSHSDRGV